MSSIEPLLDQLARAVEQIRESVLEMSKDIATLDAKASHAERDLREIRETLSGQQGLVTRVVLLERGTSGSQLPVPPLPPVIVPPTAPIGDTWRTIRTYAPWVVGGLAALGEALRHLFS